jgi:quercetin dioxygenase-like cupin family protein
MDAIVLNAGEGEKLGRFLLKSAQPELMLSEYDVGPDFGGTDPHFHKRHADAFYVLEGAVDVLVDGEYVRLGPGGFAFFPPGVVHAFKVSEHGARFLNLHTPGGFDSSIRELNALRAAGEKPDAEFFERHDIYDVDQVTG